jgi:hypothetical protein
VSSVGLNGVALTSLSGVKITVHENRFLVIKWPTHKKIRAKTAESICWDCKELQIARQCCGSGSGTFWLCRIRIRISCTGSGYDLFYKKICISLADFTSKRFNSSLITYVFLLKKSFKCLKGLV